MKALKRIGALLLSMLIVLSSFAIGVLAEEHDHSAKPLADEALSDAKCGEGTPVNVAKNATVIGDRGDGTQLGGVFWSVFDNYWCAVDGNPDTYCPADTTHWAPYGLWITLDDSYELDKIVIQTKGIGRAPSSKGSSDQLIDRSAIFPFTVELYDYVGTRLDRLSLNSTGDKNVEIDLENTDFSGLVHQIYIFVDGAYVTSTFQGIWEVEAWTNDIHDWQELEKVTDPTCTERGIMAVRCADCGEEKESPCVPTVPHVDKCTKACAICGTYIDGVKHEGANGCLSTECVKCGATMTSGAHQKSTTDPCDTSCTLCGATDVIEAPHVHDISNPCNNDCVKCGAQDVIPDAYDIGARITRTDWVLPYTYAPHVASTTDPCSATCASCGKQDAVRPVHVLPDDPCKQTTCGNPNCFSNQDDYVNPNPGESVFAHYRQGNLIQEPHVRPDTIYGEKSPLTNTYTCRLNCAMGHSGYVLSYAHEYSDCSDKTCNICLETYDNLDERFHTFTAESPTKCVDCGRMMKGYTLPGFVCPGHQYDGPCDARCNVDGCDYQRYNLRTGYMDYWHIYDNSCDTTCNDCNATRTIEHKYPTAACGELCTVCGVKRTTETPHTYPDIVVNGETLVGSNACNPLCSECKETREVEHTYAYVCAPVCSLCKTPHAEAATLHVWDGPCDTRCNNVGCTETRVAAHEWDNACDTTCNVTGCGYVREITHSYTSVCDTTCDVCQHARTDASAHKYTNACDATCNNTGCDYTRTAETDDKYDPDHEYENACGTICKICGASRTVEHVYDNACDNSCNKCGVPNPNFAAHDYGEWVTTVEPTEETEGVQTRTCKVCGVADSETQVLPKVEPSGLGTGAIIGIVSGSVVVVGGGGFSLWWFVIRKKFLKG